VKALRTSASEQARRDNYHHLKSLGYLDGRAWAIAYRIQRDARILERRRQRRRRP
jgi:hypothetical protein